MSSQKMITPSPLWLAEQQHEPSTLIRSVESQGPINKLLTPAKRPFTSHTSHVHLGNLRLPASYNHARQALLAAWRTSAIDLTCRMRQTATCKLWLSLCITKNKCSAALDISKKKRESCVVDVNGQHFTDAYVPSHPPQTYPEPCEVCDFSTSNTLSSDIPLASTTTLRSGDVELIDRPG
jgi:hypothetical protein